MKWENTHPNLEAHPANISAPKDPEPTEIPRRTDVSSAREVPTEIRRAYSTASPARKAINRNFPEVPSASRVRATGSWTEQANGGAQPAAMAVEAIWGQRGALEKAIQTTQSAKDGSIPNIQSLLEVRKTIGFIQKTTENRK